MTLLKHAANGFYRNAARVVANVLGTSSAVESVMLHRSAATGEVSFGRSDIDLVIVMRRIEAADREGREMWDLYRKVRLLRRLNPALGHIEVHDSRGFEEWCRVDTYRASLERRSALVVYGKRVEIPPRAVRPDHAAMRFALHPHYFLSRALQQRNRRNLRKIALEMWNAYATASGKIQEPFLTRRETEEFCRAAGAQPSPQGLNDGAIALRFIFETTELMHRAMCRPLKRMTKPVVFQAPLPPGFFPKTFVVLPRAGAEVPTDAFVRRAIIVTPELLDLYIRFANAFAYPMLPVELRGLGFQPPRHGDFLRTAQYEFHSHWLRYPGFIGNHLAGMHTRMATFRQVAEKLARGESPRDLAPPAGREAMPEPSLGEYYRSHYGLLRTEQERLWQCCLRRHDDLVAEDRTRQLQ